ncbi:MAG: class I SAM-dependent methyltransferase, partial [Deltaproteobacteria bacterium]|nr:class I SAM-dependent methyltransferase [Deltaproteobacteria bacterium]
MRRKLCKQGVDVLQCSACALAFWLPAEHFDPSRIYDADYFASDAAAHGYDDYAALEPALRATFRRRVARLRLPSGARLLDVGAAYGYAASEAQRAGLRVAAVELSREAAARAAGLVPGRVARASADRLPFSTGSFDAVTLWDVLEHLPDPHGAVAEIARCLRPGGRLALTTGDVGSLAARVSGARWHLYTLPEHLFFYSRESLRRLLGAHGLRVEQLRAEGALYPLGYLVERLRKTLFGGAGSTPVRFPGARVVLPVNLFDVLTVVAVR